MPRPDAPPQPSPELPPPARGERAAPAAGPPGAARPEDEPLPCCDEAALEALRARDRAEEQEAKALARGLEPGRCPVCDAPTLAAVREPAWVRPFLARPGLRCDGCGLEAERWPSRPGWALATGAALATAWGGAWALLAAQRLQDPNLRTALLILGGLAFAGGLRWGARAQSAGSTELLAGRLVRGWRRRRGEPDPGEHAPGWLGDHLEAIVVAVVLALVIRHVAMEAFVIPTGSMAPTLLGDHFVVGCDGCGAALEVGCNEGEFRWADETRVIEASCALCQRRVDVEVRPQDVRGGNKILVNKLAYRLGRPQRWDVAVFRFPRQPWRNYIKRLVGLPGERLEVKNGDLWVDGALARKPDAVQDALWIPALDTWHDDPEAEASHQGWSLAAADGDPDAPPDPAPAWERAPGGRRLVCRPPAGRPTPWLRSRPVRDEYVYSRGWERGRNLVADLRVRATVVAAEGAVIRLGVVENGRVLSCELPVRAAGPGTFALLVDGAVQLQAEGPALRPGRPAEVVLAYADDRARVLVDGVAVLPPWLDAFGPPRTDADARALVGARGGEVAFERVRVDRDVHYVPTGSIHDPGRQAVDVPADGYFALGDNSPSSEDGRRWGFLREGHLVGRAFLVFWPLEGRLIR